MGEGGQGRRPRAPRLPDGAPPGLREFVACTADGLRLDLGDTDWLPAPGGIDVAAPQVEVEPGPRPGSVTVTASWGGFVSVTLPVSVVDGRLDVDVSEVPSFLADGVREWVEDLNDHLEANGKGLGHLRLDGTVAVLQKVPLAPAPSEEAPANGAGVGTAAPEPGAPESGAAESIMDYVDEDALHETMTRPLHGRTGSPTGMGTEPPGWVSPWADQPAPEWVTNPDWITPEELERLREDVQDTTEARGAAQDASSASTRATSAVTEAQRQLGALQRHLVTRWAEGHARFKQSMLGFAEAYLGAWQASEPLRARSDDWRVHKEAAWAIDMAFGLIQLSRGVFTIGRGLKGWVQGRQAARLARMGDEAAAAARAAAGEALEASPVLRELVEQQLQGATRAAKDLNYRDELIDMIVRGRDAGADIIRVMEDEVTRLADFARDFGKRTPQTIVDRLHHVVVTASAEALGLVEAAPAVANAVDDAVGAAHVVAGNLHRLSPEMLQSLRNFVRLVDETPGFWDDAGNMYVRLTETGEVTGLVSPERLQVLRATYHAVKQAGDEPLRIPLLLAEALGPAKVTAMRAVADGAARAGGQARAAWQVGTGAADVADTAGVGPTASGATIVGAVGGVDAHTAQYGITTDSYAGNLWDLVTSPVETTGGMWHSWFALGELQELLETTGQDLTTMGGSFDTTVHAVEQLLDVARSDAVDDVATALQDLEAARQALVEAHAAAPQAWQDEHSGRLQDQLAHIDQQRAAMTDLLRALQQLAAVGGDLAADLRAVQRGPDGTRRDALEYIDPDVAATLAQVAHALEGLGHEVTGGGPAGDAPPSWEAQWEQLDAESKDRADELDEVLLDDDDSPIDVDLDFEDGEERPAPVLGRLDDDPLQDSTTGVRDSADAVRERRLRLGVLAAAAAGVLALGVYLAAGGSPDPAADGVVAGGETPTAPEGDAQAAAPTEEPAEDDESVAFPAPDDLEAWAMALEQEAFLQRLYTPVPPGSDLGPGVRTFEDVLGDVAAEADPEAAASGGAQVELVAQASDYAGPDVDILGVALVEPAVAADVVEQLACGSGAATVRGACDAGAIAAGDHAMTVMRLAAPMASGDAVFYTYTIGWQSTPDPADDLANGGGALEGFDRWASVTVNPDGELIPIEIAGPVFVPLEESSLRWVAVGDLLVLFHPPGAPYDGPLRVAAAAFDDDGPPAIGADSAPDSGFRDLRESG